MTQVFLCGPLADAGFRAAALGADVPGAAATLQGAALVGDATRPRLLPRSGAEVMGIVARVDPEQLSRLRFWMVDLPGRLEPLDTGATLVWWGDGGVGAPHGPAPDWNARDWNARDWETRWRATAIAAVPDVMMLKGECPAAQVFARWSQILTRAGGRVRAATPGPVTLRHDAKPGDVLVERTAQPYAHFFAVEEYELRFRRFDGSLSNRLNRAAFISGDAVVVLPYDPIRDRVLLIEQFRAGAFGRGDPQPWLIEGIAGRIDGGETPESSARREAVEEAGLTLGALHKVADYYPSPGAKTEYIYSFIGLCDLPDTEERLGGLPGEGEDIRSHILPFARLMDLVARNEVTNAPLILCAYWLSAHRDRLRKAAGA